MVNVHVDRLAWPDKRGQKFGGLELASHESEKDRQTLQKQRQKLGYHMYSGHRGKVAGGAQGSYS